MLRRPALTKPARAAAAVAGLFAAAALLGVGWAGMSGSAAAAAGDPPARETPLAVASASFAQDGQQVVWTLEMQQPFSPGGLARDGRVLCLELDPGGRGGAKRVCVIGPARGSAVPRVEYVPPAGADAVLAATVSRGNSRELTAVFLPSAVGQDYAPVHWLVVSGLAGSACRRARQHGIPCALDFRTRAGVASLHVPQLVGCVPSGPRLVYQGPPAPPALPGPPAQSGQREVALTFDDGPAPDTTQFLDILEREHVVATFFQIGKWVGVYGEHGAIGSGSSGWTSISIASGGSAARLAAAGQSAFSR